MGLVRHDCSFPHVSRREKMVNWETGHAQSRPACPRTGGGRSVSDRLSWVVPTTTATLSIEVGRTRRNGPGPISRSRGWCNSLPSLGRRSRRTPRAHTSTPYSSRMEGERERARARQRENAETERVRVTVRARMKRKSSSQTEDADAVLPSRASLS